MSGYSTEIKKLIKKIIWDMERCISQFFLDAVDILKVGVVTYRDHLDEGISYLTNIDIDLTTNLKKVIDIVNFLHFWGGKDEPEAVLDGIKVALDDISWRDKSVKFICHILDAPFHGKKFNNCEIDKLEECQKKIKVEDLLAIMRKKGIKYNVIKLNDSVDIMLKEFKRYINLEVISPKINIDKTQIKIQE